MRETLKICDKSYVVNSGQVLASGKSKDLIKDEIVKKVYLGEKFKLWINLNNLQNRVKEKSYHNKQD